MTQRTVRRRVMGNLTLRLEPAHPRRTVGSGAARIVTTFGLILFAGFILLWLPFADSAGAETQAHVALFTAVSAISVTGLTVVETGDHWSTFGHVVILLLIQIGGLGYMLGTTVILWALGRRLGVRDRHLMRIYYGAPSLGETISFAKGVAIFAGVFEAAGAAILTFLFYASGEPLGRSLWWGVFHSISAFNNAGFTITGADMLPYADNPAILLTLTILILAGSIGFLPVVTLRERKSFDRLPLDHKLIYATTLALLLAGAAFFTLSEWDNDQTIGGEAELQRPVVAVFQAANRTSGFAAVPFGESSDETKVAMIGLMFVGGAAGSTAGGLKVGAFSLLLVMMISTVQGKDDVTAFGRSVPMRAVRQATTLALYFVALVFGTSLLLSMTSEHAFLDVLLEAVSALATVGYSSAGTANFNAPTELVLAVAMLVGRFSPLILVLYMTRPRHQARYRHPEDSVRLG